MRGSLSGFIGRRYAGAGRRSGMVSFISGLSMTGIILGVALLVTVLSVMNGFERELREKILNIIPQGSLYHRNGLANWEELREGLLQRSDIQGIAPFIELQGMLSYRNQTAPLVIYGIDPELELSVSDLRQYVAASEWQMLAQEQGILLGQGIADKLRVNVGDRLTLLVPPRGDAQTLPEFTTINLVGIIKTHTELDHVLALLTLNQAKMFFQGEGKVSGLRFTFTNLFMAPTQLSSLASSLPYGFYATDWTRTHGNLYQAIALSKRMVGLVLFLVIAIAAFNVVSTLIMMVIDKQSDIAILRTLGASRRDIMAIFMWQGSLIGVVGTAVGLLLGVVCSLGVRDVIAWLESLLGFSFLHSDVYPISYVPADMQVGDFIVVGLVSLVLSFFSTLYPAWRASRINPAEALRHE